VDDGGELTAMVASEHPDVFRNLIGLIEVGGTGATRLLQMAQRGQLLVPAINVNESVTKSKFDNLYGCREGVVQAIRRATGFMVAGKQAVVCGYGDVGKGVCTALRAYSARVTVTEVDPICALQACMEGFSVACLEDAAPTADIIITCTGNRDIVRRKHLDLCKDGAIICNMGHFEREISADILQIYRPDDNDSDLDLKRLSSMVDELKLPSGKTVILLAEGGLVNLACSQGHPSFVMSISFTNVTLAIRELFSAKRGQFVPGVYQMPKHLDEEVARLHLTAYGASLTRLTKEQAGYLGLPISGPFKAQGYRY
jgi:adenosylhomocysteinase